MSYLLHFSLVCLYSAALAHANLTCIVLTYTLNTSATKKKSEPYWSDISKGVHRARLEKTELQRSPRKRNSCRAETGASADLPHSAQQELHKLPQHAHSQRRGKIHLQPHREQVRHILAGEEVPSAPKNSINPDTNKINGLKFHKWLKQSMSFWVQL